METQGEQINYDYIPKKDVEELTDLVRSMHYEAPRGSKHVAKWKCEGAMEFREQILRGLEELLQRHSPPLQD